MYTILINSEDKGCSYNEFEEKFITICNLHRDENRALMFAFILYDFTNPQISKILNDSDYWLSLNSLSGNYLTVFSFHYKSDDIKSQLQDIMHSKIKGEKSKGTLKASKLQDPSMSANGLIKKYFGEEVTAQYPSVVFFQVDQESVINFRFIQLDENKLEESFAELKNYIGVAVDSLTAVTRDNKNNYSELFNLVDSRVAGTRRSTVVKKGINKLISITNLLSTLIGLK